VTLRRCAMEYVGLSIAGPNARALLQGLVREDLATAAFPFLSFERMDIGVRRQRRADARLTSGGRYFGVSSDLLPSQSPTAVLRGP
jgi:hypothetical protein